MQLVVLVLNGHSKLPIGVSVRVNGFYCLSVLVLRHSGKLSWVYPAPRSMVAGIGFSQQNGWMDKGMSVVFTWSSWDPCKLGQILSLSNHHLDALGQCLVLQQDEQLPQSPWHTHRALPAAQRFLRTHTLRVERTERRRDRNVRLRKKGKSFLSLSRCLLHLFGELWIKTKGKRWFKQ